MEMTFGWPPTRPPKVAELSVLLMSVGFSQAGRQNQAMPSICARVGAGALMGFAAIFAAGLLGYAQAPIWTMFVAALALVSLTYARQFVLVQRGLDGGLDEIVQDALLRTSFNALIATGGCFGFGYVLRVASGL